VSNEDTAGPIQIPDVVSLEIRDVGPIVCHHGLET
jgi:hypothetical protein